MKSRTIWTDGNYNLVYECHRVLFDGSCVPGYDALVLFAHAPNHPPEVVLDQIRAVAEAGQCFDFNDLEYVAHERKEIFVDFIFTNALFLFSNLNLDNHEYHHYI